MTGLEALAVTGALVLLVALALLVTFVLLVDGEAEVLRADEALLAMFDGFAGLAGGALFLATVEDGVSGRRVG